MNGKLLTSREREVLALISSGKTASEVAETLDIAEETVEADVRSAARKLGAASSAHNQAMPATNMKTLGKRKGKSRPSDKKIT
jgi:DNA-binding CsgD family transcriptional regulator